MLIKFQKLALFPAAKEHRFWRFWSPFMGYTQPRDSNPHHLGYGPLYLYIVRWLEQLWLYTASGWHDAPERVAKFRRCHRLSCSGMFLLHHLRHLENGSYAKDGSCRKWSGVEGLDGMAITFMSHGTCAWCYALNFLKQLAGRSWC